ncbi:MAG: hypothetical protein QM680_01770 [Luteolibacter sp.]
MKEAFQVCPVLLVIFNRSDLTEKVFERIREIRPRQLFIAADGPRKDRENELELCRKAREVTRTIDWDCEVHRLERSENLGCKMAVSTAISWFFEHVEEGIILEDDCLPDVSFFRFCTELLEKYRHDPRIALISGNNFQTTPPACSYYFSRYPHIWGWASWRRVWESYDVGLSSWNGNPSELSGFIKAPSVRKRFGKHFDSVKAGRKNSWAYPLVYLCFKTQALSINPKFNLVENVGFDERATHTDSTSINDVLLPETHAMSFPLEHPTEVVVNEDFDRYTEVCVHKIPRNQWGVWEKSFQKRIRKLISRYP